MNNKSPSIRDLLVEADAAYKDGNTDRAVLVYSTILARNKNSSKAARALQKIRKSKAGNAALTQEKVNLAVSLYQSREYAQCAELSKSLIILAPQEPVLFNIAGMALSSLGNNENAIEYFRTALILRPSYSEAQANLGTALLKSGDLASALVVLKKVADQNPVLMAAQVNYGFALYQNLKIEEAIERFDYVLGIQPQNIDALNGKGTALQKDRQTDEAIKLFQQGLELSPNNLDLLINLGYALSENYQEAEAAESLEKAVSINKSDPEIWFRLGVIRANNGDFQQALESLDRAISLNPLQGDAWRSRAVNKKFVLGDTDISKMAELFENNPEETEFRMHMGFALGKAYEDTGNYSDAFKHWDIGNKLRKIKSPYDSSTDKDLFNLVKTTFNKDFFDNYSGYQDHSENLYFVVGMMRSGTTLVEQILSGHSKLNGIGEQPYFHINGHQMVDELASGSTSNMEKLAKGYLEKIHGRNPGPEFPVNKMPINFLWIGLIKALFPKAKFIHLSREPRDICLSIYKNYFDAEGNLYAYDLEDIGRFYLMHREMIAHWNNVLPGAIHTVRYEEITKNFDAECRSLIAFCDLEWESGLQNFYKSRRVVKTASVSQVRKKIYTTSIAAWKKYETEISSLDLMLKNAGE